MVETVTSLNRDDRRIRVGRRFTYGPSFIADAYDLAALRSGLHDSVDVQTAYLRSIGRFL